MREKKQIHSIVTLLPLVGLVMLLLFSPCKVRNYVQEALGVVQTEVSSKSITTLTSSNCNTLQEASNIDAYYSPTTKNISTLTINRVNFLSFSTTSLKKESKKYEQKRELSPLVPYYILYKNTKTYL